MSNRIIYAIMTYIVSSSLFAAPSNDPTSLMVFWKDVPLTNGTCMPDSKISSMQKSTPGQRFLSTAERISRSCADSESSAINGTAYCKRSDGYGSELFFQDVSLCEKFKAVAAKCGGNEDNAPRAKREECLLESLKGLPEPTESKPKNDLKACSTSSRIIAARVSQKLSSGGYFGSVTGGSISSMIEFGGMMYRDLILKPLDTGGFDSTPNFSGHRMVASTFNLVAVKEITMENGFPGKALIVEECKKK